MHLSTSNSKEALNATAQPNESWGKRTIPEGQWFYPLLAACGLFVLGALGAEAHWRELGHRPSADAEDLDLWAIQRRAASNHDPKTMVIIGKSRAQLDIHLPTLEQRYPDYTILQLALRGRGAFAVFEDLAEDPSFRGRLIFCLTEPDLSLGAADEQREAVSRAEEAGPDALWNAFIRARVASHLVTRSPLFHPQRVFRSVFNNDPIGIDFIQVDPDRATFGDFKRADLPFLMDEIRRVQNRSLAVLGNMETPVWPWTDHIRRLDPLIEKLRARGGDVVFVHLPVTGISEQFSMRAYPKHRFWDYLARTVRAQTIHYRDIEALRRFRCPDTSHLDMRDAPRFTSTLWDVLEERRFLIHEAK